MQFRIMVFLILKNNFFLIKKFFLREISIQLRLALLSTEHAKIVKIKLKGSFVQKILGA